MRARETATPSIQFEGVKRKHLRSPFNERRRLSIAEYSGTQPRGSSIPHSQYSCPGQVFCHMRRASVFSMPRAEHSCRFHRAVFYCSSYVLWLLPLRFMIAARASLLPVFSALWPSCVQCMSFRPPSVGFPGGGCAAPGWFVRWFGGCCSLLCHAGCLVVWCAPFSVGVGVGFRVFCWLAGLAFWSCLFWLCAIITRTILRFARKKN